MRNIICFLLFSSIFCCSGIPSIHSQIPDGMSRIVDNFFMDQAEVTNGQYREYLQWIAKNKGVGSVDYQWALPDTLVWRTDSSGYIEPLIKYYFRHKAYSEYPVVGLNHEQAIKFCQWRNKGVLIDGKLQNWTFRLPSPTEWKLVARLNRSMVGSVDQLNPKAKKMILHASEEEDLSMISSHRPYTYNIASSQVGKPIFTAPVRSYLGGTLGIYNMYGNVAEMLSVKGKALGGSFRDDEKKAFSEQGLTYDGPRNWLGFRCICETNNP